MNRLVLIFASSSLFACATQAEPTDSSDLDISLRCHTSADCPTPAVCDISASAVCHLPPAVQKCASDAECGLHERCNPVCASAVGVVGHVCRPDGEAVQTCPEPTACATAAQCAAGDTCFVCPSSTAVEHGVCLPPGAAHACPIQDPSSTSVGH